MSKLSILPEDEFKSGAVTGHAVAHPFTKL